MARQLIVFIENRLGALGEMLEALADAEVNIDALLLEGSVDFGVARLHVDKPRKGEQALRNAGFQTKMGDALVITMMNEPGVLVDITKKLAKAKINVEAIFGTAAKRAGEAEFVLMVDDLEKARKVLGLTDG